MKKLLLIIASSIIVGSCTEINPEDESVSSVTVPVSVPPPTAHAMDTKYIAGLRPEDVYLHFEKQGFTTKKEVGGAYGNFWTSTARMGDFNYKVQTFSHNNINVETVTITLKATPPAETNSCNSCYELLSSTPYPGKNPADALKFLLANVDIDDASTIIGGVEWNMTAPTKGVRTITLKPR